MKKKIITIIIALLAIITITISAFAENIDTTKIGDVNGDSKITASDARIVLRVAAHLDAETENILLYGDINKDGNISASDARTILRVAANLENMQCIVSGHDLDEKVIEPTCTNEGYTTLVCTRCSHTENVKVNIQPKKEHSFKKGSVIKGTCVSDGYTEYKCSTCGTVEKRDITKAGGHKYEYISKEFINTREFIGYKSIKKCTYCNKKITTYDVRDSNMQIETQPIYSNTAKNIQEKFEEYTYTVEGYDITGKKVVIYGTMDGIDIDGYFYNLDGTLMSKCERCGKTAGLGEGMCNLLFCGISFN